MCGFEDMIASSQQPPLKSRNPDPSAAETPDGQWCRRQRSDQGEQDKHIDACQGHAIYTIYRYKSGVIWSKDKNDFKLFASVSV